MGVEVEPRTGGQESSTVANAAALAVPNQVGSDIMPTVEEMIENVKVERFSLHGELGAEKRTHARALMDNIHLRQNREKAVGEKKEAALLLAAEKGKQKNSAVVEWLKKTSSQLQ